MKHIVSSLSKPLLEWFDQHGRHDLPWQQDVSAYRVWVSEIMLQQTQVTTVIRYYQRFMHRFATVVDLANAPLDEILHLWSGLGYYARARNLHRCAKIVVDEWNGEFPRDIDALIALPGIGRSTAGAILSLAYGEHAPILDGNVKRVLARVYEIEGWTGSSSVQKILWQHAQTHTPVDRVGAYTQAIMDLGATICVRSKPRCGECPLRECCHAYANTSQSKYPNPKPRKALPEKSTKFVIARNIAGETLLWQRPPSGIWGGLWSFPELSNGEDIESWCNRIGLRLERDVRELPSLRHTFTHFRLHITPIEIAVTGPHAVMDSDQWLWYNVEQPARIGLASPVTQLLGSR